jgi:hypothetical protein
MGRDRRGDTEQRGRGKGEIRVEETAGREIERDTEQGRDRGEKKRDKAHRERDRGEEI